MLPSVSFCVCCSLSAHLRYNQRDLSLDGLLDTGGSDGGTVSLSGHLRCMKSWIWRAYGTKMAVAVAPVSLIPCSTLAKTGRPRCSWPAFLGLVPPTTLVPARACQWVFPLMPDCASRGRIPYSMACCAWKLRLRQRPPRVSLQAPGHTHVPCLPVKPWNSTLVSPLMRRF